MTWSGIAADRVRPFRFIQPTDSHYVPVPMGHYFSVPARQGQRKDGGWASFGP